VPAHALVDACVYLVCRATGRIEYFRIPFARWGPMEDTSEKLFRRRIAIFCCTFLIGCGSGLAYVYTRPAEYRSVARLQISPPGAVSDEGDSTKSPTIEEDPQAFLTEVQALTSRPLLDGVLANLKKSGRLPDLGKDPAGTARQMVHATPIADTKIVELSAIAPQPVFASDLVNALVAAYRQELAKSYESHATKTYADLSAEASALERQVAAKSGELEAYRAANDIVSLQSQENGVLASISQLTETYAQSNQKLAAANGQLKALRAAQAAGQSVVLSKDDPTLANLEQRASTLREQLKDLERRFTPDYLALDADARALQARVANLDQQIRAERAASAGRALADAQEGAAGAQAEVARLSGDLDKNKKAAEAFAARLARFQAMQDDLDHLRAMQRQAQDRLLKLEASQRERAPAVDVLEPAEPSRTAWSPPYTIDAGLTVASSLVLALLAVWLVEFVVGPKPARAAIMHHSIMPQVLEHYSGSQPRVAIQRPINPPRLLELDSAGRGLRDLSDAEIAALMSGASADGGLAIAAILSGISPTELSNLRWQDLDLKAAVATAPGSGRILSLEEPLLGLLRLRATNQGGDEPLLEDGHNNPVTLEDIDRLLLYAAYDAAIERPQEVTAAALRHTYLLFLLRQGVRASEIEQIAGSIPHSELIGYLQQVPPGERRPITEIARVHSALG
jgi:polysaccharide biosynthesis transport protein